MKAYCINLDRRPDRLAHMTAEFAKVGIPFERIPAVDGQDPDVAAAAARLPVSSLGVRLSAGAYGCLESHREAWRLLIDSGDTWGFIFEDDVILAQDMSAYLKDDWIPADADIVKLETYQKLVHVSVRSISIPGNRQLAQLKSRHLGTGGYVIRTATAERLFRETAHERDAVDVLLFSTAREFFASMKIYQMIPAPVVQGQWSAAHRKNYWAATSLAERFEGRIDPIELPKEPWTLKLRKKFRVRQRIRGLFQGTRFQYIPFG